MVYNGAVAKEARIFELSDTILERIIFAMEDQSRSHYIDLRTGDLVPKPGKTLREEALPEAPLPEWIAPPPQWSPADGFRLMEAFCGRINRMELKLALNRVLGRGKGVFKAFRQVLAEYPREDALFRDYKNATLRCQVELWMDDMREVLGLARLSVEPEDFQDLVDEEFCLEARPIGEAPFPLAEFFAQALEEALDWSPPFAAALEKTGLDDFLRRHGQDGFLHYMNEAEGKPIAMAAMAFVDTEAGPVGLIRFLYVVPEFRGLGLELKLIDSLRRRCRDAGLGACFLRSALLSPGLSASLDGWGLKTCGTQYLID